MNKKSSYVYKNGIQEFPNYCYWCNDSNNLVMCQYCNRNFCRLCVKISQNENTNINICLICGCLEFPKDVSDELFLTKDREVLYMLQRYESLCNNTEIMKDMNDNLHDIDSIEVNQFPTILQKMHTNVSSMLNDIERLSKMVSHTNVSNNVDCSRCLMLPLFKILIKHHLFKRLGRPQRCLNETEMTNDISKLKIDTVSLRTEESPLSVSKEEELLVPLKIIDENEYMDDAITEYMSEILPKDILDKVKNETLLSKSTNVFLQMSDEEFQSSVISNNSLCQSQSVSSISNQSDSFKNTQIIMDDFTRSSSRPTVKMTEINYQLKGYRKMHKKIGSNDNKSRILWESKKVDVSKCNPHLVSPANICQEKSFVIQSADKIDAVNYLAIPPPVHKMWSWERNQFKIVIPQKRHYSMNDSPTEDITGVNNIKNESLSTESLLDCPNRKKGRPRKYYSHYGTSVDHNHISQFQ